MRSALIAATLLASGLMALPSHAQVYSGSVVAIDGDTLDMTGARIRLFGIDAVEKAQTCERSGVNWACGADAGQALSRLVSGRAVLCTQQDTDDYGRVVAICRVGDVDLGEAMVRMGYAIALPHFTQAYVNTEAGARARKAGIWGWTFDKPADHRAAHPRDHAPAVHRRDNVQSVRRPASGPRAAAPSSGVYFRNCREAWAAGRAPLHIGQPGYRREMDGDGDGVACEPIRRRR